MSRELSPSALSKLQIRQHALAGARLLGVRSLPRAFQLAKLLEAYLSEPGDWYAKDRALFDFAATMPTRGLTIEQIAAKAIARARTVERYFDTGEIPAPRKRGVK